jgi:hypothetical protein
VGSGFDFGVGRGMVVPGPMTWEGLTVNALPLTVTAVVPALGATVMLPIITELPGRGRKSGTTVADE